MSSVTSVVSNQSVSENTSVAILLLFFTLLQLYRTICVLLDHGIGRTDMVYLNFLSDRNTGSHTHNVILLPVTELSLHQCSLRITVF